MITVVDLFAGAGGLSLGFRAAGCHIAAAVDHDDVAARTFRENFASLQPDSQPTVFGGEDGELERLDLRSIAGGADILIGGPPCQGFSRLGQARIDRLNPQRDGDDPRNELYRKFLDAIAF
jgi:DNA (cytosine-5)-methyltransferase 1